VPSVPPFFAAVAPVAVPVEEDVDPPSKSNRSSSDGVDSISANGSLSVLLLLVAERFLRFSAEGSRSRSMESISLSTSTSSSSVVSCAGVCVCLAGCSNFVPIEPESVARLLAPRLSVTLRTDSPMTGTEWFVSMRPVPGGLAAEDSGERCGGGGDDDG